MTLRAKLLLAQAPLALALIIVGTLATTTISSLGRNSNAILKDNYRSVLAAQSMREALEHTQHAASTQLLGAAPRSLDPAAAAWQQRFNNELRIAEGNITEPGEHEAIQQLRQHWSAYLETLDHLQREDDRQRATFFLATVRPAYDKVKLANATILAMNQDAMVDKSETARREADRLNNIVLVAALAALLIGALLSAMMTNQLLQPLGLLTRMVHQIGEGNLEIRADIGGSGEIAQLAGSVNTLAARLSEYRRSSLGELLVAQQSSQAAIDSLPDPVLVFDASGELLNANQAAATLLSIEVGAPGQALASASPEVRGSVESMRQHVLRGQGTAATVSFDESICIQTPSGDRYLLPRATPVHSEEGATSGFTVVFQDVTRVRLVDELRNDLVATVAHELRTPLTSLRMAIHLCLEQTAGPLSDKQADLLYAARDDCQRLQFMVDELLDLARIQGGQVELQLRSTDADALVTTALSAYRAKAEEEDIALSAQVLPGLPPVHVDRERLQLVLSNLIGNALRHTPPGGRIAVQVRSDKQQVRFEIKDSGPGIPAEYQERIFDKFFRVPGMTSGGAGIGLSICKEIIAAHGGEIGVDSTPGAGATFWFTVPSAPIADGNGVMI